jgi:hypothetical protein
LSEQATLRPAHPPPESDPELLPDEWPPDELLPDPELLPPEPLLEPAPELLPELLPDPLPVQPPHWHPLPHACMPPPAQLRVVPGEHAPSSEHVDQPDHVPVVPSQVLD